MAEVIKTTKRIDMGRCVLCNRIAFTAYNGGAVRLKDKSPLCGNCVRMLRFIYPFSACYDKKGNVKYSDGLSSLSPDDVKKLFCAAGEMLEDLRQKYTPWNAVFRIDSYETEKQGFFKPAKNSLNGFVLLGRFNVGDSAVIIQGERKTEIVIEEFGIRSSTIDPGCAGYQTELCFFGKPVSVSPGDLIVKE